jgi:hypothetical protein
MTQLRTCIAFLETASLIGCVLWQANITLNEGSLGVAAFQSIVSAKSQTNHPTGRRLRFPQWISRSSSISRHSAAATNDASFEYALLFDCDGVILETEELHRLAYNEAFRQFRLTIDKEPVVWSVRLLTVYWL